MLSAQCLAILLITGLRLVNGIAFPSAPSHKQAPAFINSRIDQRNAKGQLANESQSARHLVPLPSPSDTVGEYFDKYASILDSVTNGTHISATPESSLTDRSLVRATGFLQSIWNGSQDNYNISLARCIRFADKVGTWTNLDGTTTENATLQNVNDDLQTHFTNTKDLSDHITDRLLTNVKLAISEAEAFLSSTICDYNTTKAPTPAVAPLPAAEDPTDDTTGDPKASVAADLTHDELRKLLDDGPGHGDVKFWAQDGYWTTTLMSVAAIATVGGSLYKGFYNHNATTENVAIVCFAAGGLALSRGILERFFMTGHARYIEVSVISAFVAWYRQALAMVAGIQREYMRQVGSDNHMSGCLEEIVVVNSVDSLPGYSQPQAGIIELVPMGCM